MATRAPDDDHMNGCMIALMPTEEDAARLAILGGEKAAELHCTLFFLGDDAAVWNDHARGELISLIETFAQYEIDGPVEAKIFGAAHWNGDSPKPSWVWSVGDASPGSECLSKVRHVVIDAMESTHEQPDLPDQHTPWVGHICAEYSNDLTLIKEMEKRLGPVTFDRIRVSFGHEDHDIPLTDGMTAAGVPRRKLTDLEIASKADFAMIDRQWKDAVGSMMSDYIRVVADQRAQIRRQIKAAVNTDDLASLDHLSVDTDDCARLLFDHMMRLAQRAGQEMQREAEHQGVHVPPWDMYSLTAAGPVDVLRATARMTSRNLAARLVQSAARRIMALIGIEELSGDDIADDVDEDLGDLSDGPPEEQIGASMSAAQAAGRFAVLAVAPAGSYVASEALDQNTCVPCKRVDGEEFTSLSEAKAAYPAGGYVNCRGGGRCRGTIIAVWGNAEVGSASRVKVNDQEGNAVGTATETLGGKPNPGTDKDGRLHENQDAADGTETLGGDPNPGTKKDKRLKENAYATDDCEGEDCDENAMDADASHFHGGTQTLSTVKAAWDGSSSRFNDAQWKTATAACDTGDGTVKERCFLPHHDPGGALNMDGLAAAAGRANQAGSHSAQAVARAKAHLRSHYNKAGKPVPDNLKATAEEIAFGTEADYDMIIWGASVSLADMSCPPNMEMDPGTGECVPVRKDDNGAKASGNTAPWEGVLVVEGETTGDGREFASKALSWPDPITKGEVLLRWNKEDSHGGEPRTLAVAVGRIDKIWRDGNKIMGKGVFDLDNPDGAEAHRRVREGFLRGVSIDADDVKNADVELVWPQVDADSEESIFDMLFAQPEKMIYHGGRIRAATLCDIPAFIEAYIALTDDEGAIVAGGKPVPDLVELHRMNIRTATAERVKEAALVAHGGPNWTPPAEWFTNPQLSVETTIHVTDEGRIYGHAARWGSCHIGHLDVCVQPPREEDFPYFLTGELITAEGTRVSVGQITVTTNHADLYVAAGPAKEHYENTGNAVADVTVGADRIGIWVAGAIRPNADPAMVHELRASGEVSGDWRRIGGQYRLVGLLGVNVGGFVVPNMNARVASGEVQALVAAGRLSVRRPHPATRSDELTRTKAYEIVMNDLYAQMTSLDAEGSE